MRVGLTFDFGYDTDRIGPLVDEFGRLCRLAEDYAFDCVVVAESHLEGPGPSTAAPFVVASALGRQTRLPIATFTLGPLWHPLKLAYETAVLDQLLEGRLAAVCVGVGPTTTVVGRYGVPYEELAGRMDELLVAVRRLWSGEEGEDGSHFTVRGRIWPLPYREGGPPLWVGGRLRRSVRRAAALADGWYGASIYLRDELAALAALYREELARAGAPAGGGRVGCNRLTVVAETDAEARAAAKPALANVLRYYAGHRYLKTPDGRVLDQDEDHFEQFGDELFLVGSPETVAAGLRRYGDAGVTDVHLRVAVGGLPLEHVERSVRLVGERVLPALA